MIDTLPRSYQLGGVDNARERLGALEQTRQRAEPAEVVGVPSTRVQFTALRSSQPIAIPPQCHPRDVPKLSPNQIRPYSDSKTKIAANPMICGYL